MGFWKKLIGEDDFEFQKRADARFARKLKADKRKKPKSKHRKPGRAKGFWK